MEKNLSKMSHFQNTLGSMNWKPNVTVAAVIEDNQHYLLVEEKIDQRRVFNQPAGHLEENESLLDAVSREVREETAYRFVPHSLVTIQLWRHPENGLTFLRFTFCGQVLDHDPAQPLDSEIIAATWFKRVEIEQMRDRLRSPLVWDAILAYENGQRVPLEILHTLP